MSSEHSRMSLIIVLAICCSVGFGKTVDLDPDEKAFLMSISMGRGLYYNYPHIVNLNASNFDVMAKGKDYSWIIEFYNSWCGHCLRFTPTYKRLANDIKDWEPVVKIGAVDCSNQLNTPLCRIYEILSYPTVRYFPPHFGKDFYGMDIVKRTVDGLRDSLAAELLNRTDLPQLQPFLGSSSEMWAKAAPQVNYVVLVSECHPLIGPQLILDYWSIEKVMVVSTTCSTALLQELSIQPPSEAAIYVLEKSSSPRALQTGDFNRSAALTSLYTFFHSVDIQVPNAFNLSSIKDVKVDLNVAFEIAQQGPHKIDKISSNKHTDEVFQVDIEGAIRHTMNVEIPQHKHINGTAFGALKNYVLILNKYFPIGENGRNFLQCVLHGVETHDPVKGITGTEFSDDVGLCQQRYHPVYLDPDNGWLGCRGTLPMYRGFPCSMWTLFHTLTVQSYNKGAEDPHEVLKAVKGYMSNFFGCTDCAKHFMSMAVTMEGNVTSLEDSVMWLWSAHNRVNKRLHGDPTEDPNFPKVQFPTTTICPKCYHPNGIFDDKQVFNFIRKMYTNISYIVPTDLGPSLSTSKTPEASERTVDKIVASKLVRHEVIVDQEPHTESRTLATKLLWDFSVYDVSLCVILYIISMAMVVLVCIKFLRNRRSYRKKPYYNDIF
uniref:Sulfhydryl oxidase n=1 Tax=Lygus hesperus TaxID=30085 RepID=A0A0A9YL12_LYGHE